MVREIERGVLLGLVAAGMLVLVVWGYLSLTNTGHVTAEEPQVRGAFTSTVTPVELYTIEGE